MALFGGGGKSQTSSTTRPSYITNMIKGLSNDINNAKLGDYENLQYEGLNANQKAALSSMVNNHEYQNYAQQLMSYGNEGLNQLNNVYNQITNAYNDSNITPEKLNALASNLYSENDVNAAIQAANSAAERSYSLEVAPNLAQQTMQQSGFGSGSALAQRRAQESLQQQELTNANQLSDEAYNNAMQQAQNILASNQSTQRAALGQLSTNYLNQANAYGQGALMANTLNEQAYNAALQNQANLQQQYNVNYNNATNKQYWNQQATNNLISGAQVLNNALGQRVQSKTTGGGGLGGILSGAMSGAMSMAATGNPWAMAGGALVGGISGASQ